MAAKRIGFMAPSQMRMMFFWGQSSIATGTTKTQSGRTAARINMRHERDCSRRVVLAIISPVSKLRDTSQAADISAQLDYRSRATPPRAQNSHQHRVGRKR